MECWEPLGCIYETHPARRQVPRQSEHFCQFPNPILIHAALSWTHRPPEVIFEAACSEGDVRLGLVREVMRFQNSSSASGEENSGSPVMAHGSINPPLRNLRSAVWQL